MSKVYDGSQVKAMFATATRWLEMNCEAINALNVFPVPDGDTEEHEGAQHGRTRNAGPYFRA